jgi:Gram-negative porin
MSRNLTLTAALVTTTAAGLIAGQAAAQGLPEIERQFSNGATLRFYGQINKGILQYDDGQETESYGLIDNDNSGTRAGLSYEQQFGDGWTFENVNEFQYAPYSTGTINIVNQTPSGSDWDFTNANIRKIDFTFANERYGKFWVGQGSMATDGIQEIDFSGTDVIAYSSVADSAGAQLLRQGDGLLSDIAIGDVFTNYDGPRRVRLRYDTPSFYNLTFAAAYGRDLLSDDQVVREQNTFDASVSYEDSFGEVDVGAGVGYFWQEDDADSWGGSVSAIHNPTGVNGAFAFGTNSTEDENSGDGSFWYGKLGLLRDFVAWGPTAMSVDYYSGDDFFIDQQAGITGSSSDSWGLALVQTIERANTELWLTWRSYEYDDTLASYEDGTAIFGGARFSF